MLTRPDVNCFDGFLDIIGSLLIIPTRSPVNDTKFKLGFTTGFGGSITELLCDFLSLSGVASRLLSPESTFV